MVTHSSALGKPQHKKNLCSFGHCPNSRWTPRTQTGTLWHLFSGKIMQMPVCTWTFLLKIGATNHPGKGLDPPTQTGNAQMNRDIFMMVLPLDFYSKKFYCLCLIKDLSKSTKISTCCLQSSKESPIC